MVYIIKDTVLKILVFLLLNFIKEFILNIEAPEMQIIDNVPNHHINGFPNK